MRVTFICTVEAKDAANKAVDPQSGRSVEEINNGTLFTPNFSQTGHEPATHCVTGWTMEEDDYQAVVRAFESVEGAFASPNTEPIPRAAELGLYQIRPESNE